MLADEAALPMNRDVHIFAIVLDVDDDLFHEVPDDLLAIPVGRAWVVPERGHVGRRPRFEPAPPVRAAAAVRGGIDRNRRGPDVRPATSPPTASPRIGPPSGFLGRRPGNVVLRLRPGPGRTRAVVSNACPVGIWLPFRLPSRARQLNSSAAASPAQRTCCATRSSITAALRPKHTCSVPSWKSALSQKTRLSA